MTNPQTFLLDDVTVAFTFNEVVNSIDSFSVAIQDTGTDPTGPYVEVLGTEYTLSGVDSPGGVTVTFSVAPGPSNPPAPIASLAPGATLKLQRTAAAAPLTNFNDSFGYTPESFNKEFSRVYNATADRSLSGSGASIPAQVDSNSQEVARALKQPAAGQPFDAGGLRISNVAQPLNGNDAARLADVSAAAVTGLPDKTGNAGKYLRVDGTETAESWQDLDGPSVVGSVPNADNAANAADSALLDGETKAAIRARGSHTGTQTPATISPQGAGSGLDADTVDGKQASAFPELAANNVFTGFNQFNNGQVPFVNGFPVRTDGRDYVTRKRLVNGTSGLNFSGPLGTFSNNDVGSLTLSDLGQYLVILQSSVQYIPNGRDFYMRLIQSLVTTGGAQVNDLWSTGAGQARALSYIQYREATGGMTTHQRILPLISFHYVNITNVTELILRISASGEFAGGSPTLQVNDSATITVYKIRG